MKKRLFLACILLAVAAGCSNEAEIKKLAQAKRGEAQAQLDRFEAIAKSAAKQERLVAAVPLEDDVDVDFTEYKGDVEILHLEDLRDTSKPPSAPLAINYGSTPNELAHLLDTGKWEGLDNPKVVRSAFDNLTSTKYLLLLRTHDYRPARRTGESTLEPGHYEGDALLYRVQDRQLLGGFPVEFSSTEEIMLKTTRLLRKGVAFEEDFDSKMRTDMWSEFRRRVHHGARDIAPEAPPPYPKLVEAIGDKRVGE